MSILYQVQQLLQKQITAAQKQRKKMQGQQNSLKHMLSTIKQSSTITILDISNSQIIFEIDNTQYLYQKSKSKQKHYKIKYDNQKLLDNVLSIIRAYPNIKCKTSRKNIKMVNQAMRDFCFSELSIEVTEQTGIDWLNELGLLNSDKFVFLGQLTVPSMHKLYSNLFHYFLTKKTKTKLFQVQFNAKLQGNILQIVSLVQLWSKYCNIGNSSTQLQFQLQKLSILYQGQILISLENKKLYGFSICLHKYSSNVNLCLSILQLFVNKSQINNKKRLFVSIQFLDWQPKNSQPVNYIFQNFQHRDKYLVKFGNYLQITELRLFINTTGMQKGQVSNIFDLMKQPGHYQLICHSNKQFFQQAINLFLYKPLINFKYYVPLSQAQQLQKPIEIMMQKADSLRRKIQVFMSMLKSSYNIELGTVIKLFLTLSKTKITK